MASSISLGSFIRRSRLRHFHHSHQLRPGFSSNFPRQNPNRFPLCHSDDFGLAQTKIPA
jgi:hypothetical protein